MRKSIKSDPKVERPTLNEDILFHFKHVYSSGKINEYTRVGKLSINEDFLNGGWVDYCDSEEGLYTDVVWWCFIEEIF